MTVSRWITRWCEVEDAQSYLVRPINEREDGTLYLGGSVSISPGWGVKRLRERCYAALEQPLFDPSELYSEKKGAPV